MDKNQTDDPLSKLFDDGPTIDLRGIIADTVYPYARLVQDGDQPEIVFTVDGDGLTVREKLLVFFLARKALYLRELVSKEPIVPSEIETATNISGGTIRPTLKRLMDEKLIKQDKSGDGGYFVPNTRIREISSIFGKKGE